MNNLGYFQMIVYGYNQGHDTEYNNLKFVKQIRRDKQTGTIKCMLWKSGR